MGQPREALEAAASDCSRLLANLTVGGRQVRSAAVMRAIREGAAEWFDTYRPSLTPAMSDAALKPLDLDYQNLIELTARASARTAYRGLLRDLRAKLVRLQATEALPLAGSRGSELPDFTALVDPKMASVLCRRWQEISHCLAADASLAAVVMMGGTLEGVLLATINGRKDKSAAFTARAAPKRKDGRTLPLSQWRLKDLLDVAHELQLIGGAASRIGHVVRDYRNLIHPEREYAAGESVTLRDANAMWQVCQHVLRELLAPGNLGPR